MARGWESKSVEDQVAEEESDPLNPDEAKRRAHLKQAIRERHRQELELQRERVLNERTSNVNRRAALAAALADIEAKLKAFS
jgi:hypothetical protein